MSPLKDIRQFLFCVESLDELATLVEGLFSPVVNKGAPVPEFPEHPYSENELQVCDDV